MTQQKATNVQWHHGEVTRDDRFQLMGQRGTTLWFTGLSGSGKSTVAVALESRLYEFGKLAYRLDGDNVRLGINKNLGFSAADRTENIRRIGEIAKLFADAGIISLSSFISPYRADRDAVRQLHKAAGLDFIEVFVDCPLQEAEKRDPKGLTKRLVPVRLKTSRVLTTPMKPRKIPKSICRPTRRPWQRKLIRLSTT